MKQAKNATVRFLPRTEKAEGEPIAAQKPPPPMARKRGRSVWTQAVLILVVLSMLATLFV